MNGTDSIRDFFKKHANTSVADSSKEPLKLLHNQHTLLPRRSTRQNDSSVSHVGDARDFGVGLPPLANY